MVHWKIQLLFIVSKLMLTVNAEVHCPKFSPHSKECAVDELRRLGDKKEACEDLAKYVCKNWEDRQTLEENEYLRTVNFPTIKIIDEVIGHLENDTYKEPVLIKAQKFYKMCMDGDAIRSEGSLEIAKKLKEFEGYPFEICDGNSSEWQTIYEKMTNFGFNDNVFISVDVDKSAISNETIIYIEEGSSVIGNYLPSKIFHHIEEFINKSAEELGGVALNNYTIQGIIDIEKKIKDIRKPHVDTIYLSPLFQSISVKELQKMANSIRWASLLTNLTGIDVDEGTVIGTTNGFEYFRKLSKIIEDAGDRNIVNYLNFRFIFNSMRKRTVHSLAFKELMNKTDDKSYYKRSYLMSRKKYCFRNLDTGPLGKAVLHLFITKYINNIANQTLMAEKYMRFREYTIQKVSDSKFLSESDKPKLIARIKNTKYSFGYSERDFDLPFLNEYSKDIKLSNTSYFKTFYMVEQKRKRNLKKKLNEDFRLWIKTLNVDGWVHIKRNIITLSGYFMYVSYTGENEISPLQDSYGVNYQEANLIVFAAQRFNKSTESHFNVAKKCLSKIYSNITLQGTNSSINYENSYANAMKEQIALHIKYEAFKDRIQTYDTQSKIDLEKKYGFTFQQLFWITNARAACIKFKPGKAYDFLDFSFPVANVRINSYAMNSADFAKDFNCPVNSPMNIHNKCTIY